MSGRTPRFQARSHEDYVEVRIMLPRAAVRRQPGYFEEVDVRGDQTAPVWQAFVRSYLENNPQFALEVYPRDKSYTPADEPYNAGYSEGWKKCQDQLNDAYRQLAEAQKLAAERDDARVQLEKMCQGWLSIANLVHEFLSYPAVDNVESSEAAAGLAKALKGLEQLQKGFRAVVEHDNEERAREQTAEVEWTDEEIDKRIEAMLALWKWRFSRDRFPRSREGLLAWEALECRKKIASMFEAEREKP